MTGVIGRPSRPAPPQVDESVLRRCAAHWNELISPSNESKARSASDNSPQHLENPRSIAAGSLADDPFSVLARLFVLGDPVDAASRGGGARAVSAGQPGRNRTPQAATTRAFGRTSGSCRTVTTTSPPTWRRSSESADWVAGIHSPSITLAKLAVRRPVDAALDLGTGCGIQALLAAKHSTRVVATDLNKRALDFARFNAALNGIDVIDFRSGDLFEPVERRALRPARRQPAVRDLARRDLHLPRQRPAARRALPHDRPDRPRTSRRGRLCAHPGQLGLPVRNDTSAPRSRSGIGSATAATHGCCTTRPKIRVTHAAGWLRPLARTSPAEYEAALDRWLDYLRRYRIEAIGYGAVVLRRRSAASNWVRLDDIPIDRLEPASEHTLRVFEAEDYLAALPAERALLDERFELVEAHRLEQELQCRDGRFEVLSQTLVLTEGLAFRAGLDRSTTMLLPHFGQGRRLADVLAAAAADLELKDDERERFATAALAVVRRLLELGFLVRTEAPTA